MRVSIQRGLNESWGVDIAGKSFLTFANVLSARVRSTSWEHEGADVISSTNE